MCWSRSGGDRFYHRIGPVRISFRRNRRESLVRSKETFYQKYADFVLLPLLALDNEIFRVGNSR